MYGVQGAIPPRRPRVRVQSIMLTALCAHAGNVEGGLSTDFLSEASGTKTLQDDMSALTLFK